MSETRPNPLKCSARIETLSIAWSYLATELTRRDPSGINERVRKSDGESHAAPANLDVIDARRDIETFAATRAHELIDAGTWPTRKPEGSPKGAKGVPLPSTTTGDQLHAIRLRIGHWTSADSAQDAWEFDADLERLADAWRKVIESPRPSPWRHIGVACFVDDCAGRLKVRVPHGDPDQDDIERQASFRRSRPQAVCWVAERGDDGKINERPNRDHSVDAVLVLGWNAA